ncbi:MAG: dihydroorotase [Candidatus Cloacimonadota bacterium]|nr:dihydroorotase [Candidatus Cloacimonadota bacterium]
MRTLLKNGILVDKKANLLIEDDEISYIGMEELAADDIIELHNHLVLPAMIDPHVHARGLQQKDKEDWQTASLAAIKGGVATIFDMPNSLPPTNSQENFALKLKEAKKKSLVDFKLHLGTNGDNFPELSAILKYYRKYVGGIKVFLAGSSNNEVVKDEKHLTKIFEFAAQHDLVVLVHSELQSCLDRWKFSEQTIQNHALIRNRECSLQGTKLAVETAKKVGNKLYLCHISTKEEIEYLSLNKNEKIFCEVTPHHLCLNEEILSLVGNFGKVNPPLRTKEDNQALWQGVKNRVIDLVGSDHAPHELDKKNQPYSKAPSGFPGLETTLPVLLNKAGEYDISCQKIQKLTSKNAAEIFQLKKVGSIEKGNKANLVIINIGEPQPVIAAFFKSKAKYSPFDGMVSKITIANTIVNGKIY